VNRAAVLSIGTELTRGELVNSNAAWLSSELTDLGYEVTSVVTVDDDEPRIIAALERLGAEHAVIISTGGLGPTTDDLTTLSVAHLLGVPLFRDPSSLERIRARFVSVGLEVSASNEKQADFPQGARVLPNDWGTAPGFKVQIGGADAYFLPGVPREMRPIFEAHIAPELRGREGGGGHQIHLQTYGLRESVVNDKLAGIEAEHSVIIGYRAHFPETEVKVLARAETSELAAQRARGAADEVIARLGREAIYAEGKRSYAEAIGELLSQHSKTVALAESCTGGLLAKLLTDVPGSSRYFLGSAVTYANSAKTALVGVSEQLLSAHGAVSEPVASAMALGARAAFGSDFGLAITGIAGPDGGSAEKPVGLVHYALAHSGGVVQEHKVFPGDRGQVRLRAAYAALSLVRRALLAPG
jgi:nicotinamide-nucleotide amidase